MDPIEINELRERKIKWNFDNSISLQERNLSTLENLKKQIKWMKNLSQSYLTEYQRKITGKININYKL